MPVVADINSNPCILRFKYGISQVAGREIELLPKSGMAVGDVMLAIFSEVAPVGIDYRGSVEIHARHMFFVNGNDHDHFVFGCDFLHQLGRWAVGYALGQFIPASILFRAKIRSIEKFLQTENLRFLSRGLLDQLHVFVDHRLPDLLEGALGAKRVAGLNQGATDIAGHGASLILRNKTIAETADHTAGDCVSMDRPLTSALRAA